MGIRASHTFSFTVSGKTTTAEMIEAFGNAQAAVGLPNSVSFKYDAGDQRDPSTLSVTVRSA
jgi:hypothetical protein